MSSPVAVTCRTACEPGLTARDYLHPTVLASQNYQKGHMHNGEVRIKRNGHEWKKLSRTLFCQRNAPSRSSWSRTCQGGHKPSPHPQSSSESGSGALKRPSPKKTKNRQSRPSVSQKPFKPPTHPIRLFTHPKPEREREAEKGKTTERRKEEKPGERDIPEWRQTSWYFSETPVSSSKKLFSSFSYFLSFPLVIQLNLVIQFIREWAITQSPLLLLLILLPTHLLIWLSLLASLLLRSLHSGSLQPSRKIFPFFFLFFSSNLLTPCSSSSI